MRALPPYQHDIDILLGYWVSGFGELGTRMFALLCPQRPVKIAFSLQ